MKKLKLFFACLLMAVLSIGQVWADTPAAVGTTLFSEDFSSYVANDVPSGTVTTGTGRAVYGGANVTYSCTDGGSTTKIYNQNTGGGTAPEILVSKSNGTFVIEGIPSGDAQAITVSWTQNKQDITVAASGTGYSGSLSGKPSAVGTRTFDITVADGADATFTLTFTGSGSSNVRVDDIVVTVKTAGEGGAPAPTLTGVAVSGTPTKTEYHAGDNFDPAGLTVTGTYSDESTAPITSGITWSYDPSQELALNQTSIGVIATVSEIASPKFNVTGLTVTEAPAAVNYEKVTAEPTDWSGEYLLVYEADATNARVWKGADQANNYAEATISAGVIAAPEGAAVLTIAKVAESDPVVYTIMVGDKYIGQTSDANGIKIQASAIDNSISYNGTEAAIDIVASSAHLRYNSASSSYFRYYKSATYSSQKKIQLYKKVEGAVKPSAELSYAAADQKKLTKLGEAFTAPTLNNPHTVAVTYASNNTDVAEVASNGAVTIKAVGVATITASYDGTGDYKEGSASYKICVTSHAGTEADPFDVADVKNVIDAFETLENAYATGIVSNVVTTSLPAEGYISFYFSADGLTTGQQIEAYKCFGLSSAPFEALTDVTTGATVIVTGNLKKHNSTYEFDQNCHLTSYTAPAAPKTHIANEKDDPYTVAQAITFAADGVTYDLDDYVYVAGVVYDVKSFNSTNGTLDIYIKDASVENQFELFKCAGINDGSSTTPFEALTDVQVGDEVIAYGQLTVYNTMSELKAGNYLVELTRPEVAVESVSLPATETVEVGSTVTLTATVLPENASNKSLTWTVESGNAYASVADGVVTGIEEGTAVIRAASAADATKYAECTVTVTAADPTKHVVTFDATVDMGESPLSKSNISMACTSGALNNGSEYRLYKSSTTTFACSVGNITKIEFTGVSGNPISGFGDPEVGTLVTEGNNGVWTGNAESVSFVASGAQVRATEIVVTYKEDNRAAAGLTWNPAGDIELTVGDALTAPALLNPNSIDAAEITIESSNTDLATVSEGVVSLVADATGTTTITATFAGNDDYKPATISYNITVNEAGLDNVTFDATLDIAGTGELSIAKSGFTLEFTGGALDNGENYRLYKGQTMTLSASDYLIKKIEFTCTSGNPITGFADATGLDKDNNEWTGESNTVELTASNAQVRMTKIKVFYVEDTRAAAGLAWNPAEDITLTVGDELTAPALLNPNSIDAAEITIESSNTDLATVSEGVVSLVADATGTTTITATFAGNDDFKPATVSYKITVNPAHSIYVSPSLNVNFGNVDKDAEVADKTITVTLTGVDAATLTLAGDGASAFTISPAAALTASGDITISASSANLGTFAATLTISDDASQAESKVVHLSLTVNEVVVPETPVSTTSKWVAATDGDLVDGAEVLIVGVHPTTSKVYAAGEQGGNNRAAVEASVDGEGVLTPGDNTMSFILEAQEGGKFALRTSTGKYLCAASSGNNYLRTQDVLDDNGKWTLTTTSAVANGSYTRNTMFFNSSSSLFACYASSTTTQQPIAFYVPKPVTPPTADYTRSGLTVGNYATICLPNGGTISGATLFDLDYYDGANTLYLLEVTSNAMVAGRPYVFLPSATTIEVFYTDNANEDAGSYRGLVGSYSEHAITANEGNYILWQNAYYFVNSLARVGANRAYIHMASVPTEPTQQSSGAPRRRVAMTVNGKDAAQGFENLQSGDAPVKVMIDGTMYILRGEKVYDATGRLVK